MSGEAMKIKMLKTMAGPDGCFHPGDVLSVSKAEGIELLGSGAALLLDDEAELEIANIEEPEETATIFQRRRGRPPGKKL